MSKEFLARTMVRNTGTKVDTGIRELRPGRCDSARPRAAAAAAAAGTPRAAWPARCTACWRRGGGAAPAALPPHARAPPSRD
jgi:hypothetical protein